MRRPWGNILISDNQTISSLAWEALRQLSPRLLEPHRHHVSPEENVPGSVGESRRVFSFFALSFFFVKGKHALILPTHSQALRPSDRRSLLRSLKETRSLKMEDVRQVLMGADLQRFTDECTVGWANAPCTPFITEGHRLHIITEFTSAPPFNTAADFSEKKLFFFAGHPLSSLPLQCARQCNRISNTITGEAWDHSPDERARCGVVCGSRDYGNKVVINFSLHKLLCSPPHDAFN